MTDLRILTRERFLNMIRWDPPRPEEDEEESGEAEDPKKKKKKRTVWKVLVIDEGTTPLISAACDMYDIIAENISTVEGLEKRRQKMPGMEALYFLTPCENSIRLLNEDFADRSEPQYKAIHLHFMTKLPMVLRQQIAPRTEQNLLVCTELELNYRAPEARVFHFNDPDSIYSIYTGEGREADRVFRSMAKQLMTVCNSLGEYPYIRYHQHSDLCMALGSILQDHLDTFKEEHPEALHVEDRATLLILERGQDLVVPLMHDFYYQSMCYDLLPIEGHTYSYEYTDNDDQEQVREAVLSEKDVVWVRLRHMHIAEACDVVIQEFNEFLKQNKSIQAIDNKEKVQSLRQMTEALRAMPQYQEMKKQYALHMDMASRCMDEFEERRLADVAAVEQDIACGEDPLGKVVQHKHILPRLREILSADDILELDKMRLLLIAQLNGLVHAEDRRQLMADAKFSADVKSCLYKMQRLVTEEIRYSKPRPKKKSKKKQREGDVPYELSRWQPNLKLILKELHSDTLPEDFVYVADKPERVAAAAPVAGTGKSLKSGGQAKASDEPTWMKKGDDQKDTIKTKGPRIIVFFLGGYTFPEVRVCYELAQELGRDIIIGGNYHVAPNKFMEDIKSLP